MLSSSCYICRSSQESGLFFVLLIIYNDCFCAVRKCDICFSCTALVALANEMLERLHVDMRVRSYVDMSSLLFITLYEGIWAEPLKGKEHSELTYVLKIFHVIV